MNDFDELQYVLACISTHSRWAKAFANDHSQVSEFFNLSKTDSEHLINFLKKNSKKLVISSILMEEKRWTDMLVFINYTVAIVGLDLLEKYWQSFLYLSLPKEIIPQSPIMDAEALLKHLSSQEVKDTWKAVFEYEHTRNSVMNYYFELTSKQNYNEEILFAKHDCNLIINPSFVSKVFPYSIQTLVSEKEILDSEKLPEPSHNRIGFYKDKKTGLTRSLRLNEPTYNCLTKISEYPKVSDWLEEIASSFSLTEERSRALLSKLYNSNLVHLEDI